MDISIQEIKNIETRKIRKQNMAYDSFVRKVIIHTQRGEKVVLTLFSEEYENLKLNFKETD